MALLEARVNQRHHQLNLPLDPPDLGEIPADVDLKLANLPHELAGIIGLAFSGRSQQPSEPGEYYLLFHAPGTETTRLTVQSGQSPFPEVGDGNVEFIR